MNETNGNLFSSRRRRTFGAALIAAAIAVFYNACGEQIAPNSGTGTSTGTTPTAVSITPANPSVMINGTLTFSGYGGIPPYMFNILSGGGQINSTTGVYTAPNTSGVAQVQISDSQSQYASTFVTVSQTPVNPNDPDDPPGPSINLTWSYNGIISNLYCLQIYESDDTHSWDNNWLCSDRDLGLQWSWTGPINGLYCLKFLERKAGYSMWDNNYLCAPTNLGMSFSDSGMDLSKAYCVQLREDADAATWNDNYLCFN